MGERMKSWINALPWMARTVWKESVLIFVAGVLWGALGMFIGVMIARMP